MKLCKECSWFVSMSDIVNNTPRMRSRPLRKGEECDDCGNTDIQASPLEKKGLKQVKGKLLIWMCKNCKWVTVSNQSPHQMDFCHCYSDKKNNRGVYVDYEEHYLRYGGQISNMKFIAVVDADTDTTTEVWVDLKTKTNKNFQKVNKTKEKKKK